jgi:uncharacterized protein (TIGR03435 family)
VMMVRTLSAAALLGALLGAAPAFEVASIKPAGPSPMNHISSRMSVSQGRLLYTNVSLRDLLKEAFRLQDDQISGPDWIRVVRFDILAKLPAGVPSSQVPTMLQALLTDRFRLASHRQTKELPIYTLTVSKGGPKLPAAASSTGVKDTSGRSGHHATGKVTMERFADFLSRQLSRPVLDKTGLEGTFEIALDWAGDADAGASGPSLFTAVQEQLGLKLSAQKGLVEILVIDSVDRVPTEN